MSPTDNKVQRFIRSDATYHVLIWILMIGPHGFFSAYLIDEHPWLLVYCILVSDGLLIVIIYFIINNLIGKFYQTGRYLPFFVWLGILFAIYVGACVKMESDISSHIQRHESTLRYSVFYFINICRYTVIGFLFFGMREKFEQKKKLDKMTLEKLQSEINFLRAQVNPHFLFNTLNNLYGLALAKSDKAPEVIIGLSKMMDYMLNESEGTRVPLKKDVENLESYIALERIRQGNQAAIRYQVKGDVGNQLVEPLLMLPLVENAFKHGVSQMIDGAHLDVFLSVSETHLNFQVKNNYRRLDKKQSAHSGIGLTNLRRRLELFYPSRHQFDIREKDNQYIATLNLEFEPHLHHR